MKTNLTKQIEPNNSDIFQDEVIIKFKFLVNPFTTGPEAIFLLIENDNLGIINQKFIKNTVIIMEFSFTYQTNSHLKLFK